MIFPSASPDMMPDAGVMTGGPFTVTGGFWPITDVGGDNCVSFTGLSGYASFAACLTGRGGSQLPGCACADIDADADVDLDDFAAFQATFFAG